MLQPIRRERQPGRPRSVVRRGSRYRKPLYVATEIAKVYGGDPDDVAMEIRPAAELAEGWDAGENGQVTVHNQFFERVDAAFVTAYVTEHGLVAPEEIGSFAPVAPLRS